MLFVSEVTNEMIMFIAGLVTGVCLGVLLMAIFNASSYADDISEKLFNESDYHSVSQSSKYITSFRLILSEFMVCIVYTLIRKL